MSERIDPAEFASYLSEKVESFSHETFYFTEDEVEFCLTWRLKQDSWASIHTDVLGIEEKLGELNSRGIPGDFLEQWICSQAVARGLYPLFMSRNEEFVEKFMNAMGIPSDWRLNRGTIDPGSLAEKILAIESSDEDRASRNEQALSWLRTDKGKGEESVFPKNLDQWKVYHKNLGKFTNVAKAKAGLEEKLEKAKLPENILENLSLVEKFLLEHSQYGLFKQFTDIFCLVENRSSVLDVLGEQDLPDLSRLCRLVNQCVDKSVAPVIKFSTESPTTNLLKNAVFEQNTKASFEKMFGSHEIELREIAKLYLTDYVFYPDEKTKESKIALMNWFLSMLDKLGEISYGDLDEIAKIRFRIFAIQKAPGVVTPDGNPRFNALSQVNQWVWKFLGKDLDDIVQTLNSRFVEGNYRTDALQRAENSARNKRAWATITWNFSGTRASDLDIHAVLLVNGKEVSEASYKNRRPRFGKKEWASLDADIQDTRGVATETMSFPLGEEPSEVLLFVINYLSRKEEVVKYIVYLDEEIYEGEIFIPNITDPNGKNRYVIGNFKIPSKEKSRGPSEKDLSRLEATKKEAKETFKVKGFLVKSRRVPLQTESNSSQDGHLGGEIPPLYSVEDPYPVGRAVIDQDFPGGIVFCDRNTGPLTFVLEILGFITSLRFLAYESPGKTPVPITPKTYARVSNIPCPVDEEWGISQIGIGSDVKGYIEKCGPFYMVVLIGARFPPAGSDKWKTETLGLTPSDLPSRYHHLKRWWPEVNRTTPEMCEGQPMIGLALEPGSLFRYKDHVDGEEKCWPVPGP